MQRFIHAQSVATWCSTSRRAVMPFAPFAFGRMTRFSSGIHSWRAVRIVSVFTRHSSSSCVTAHRSIDSRVRSAHQQILTEETRSGGLSTQSVNRICGGIQRQTTSVGVHPVLMRAYTTGEMIIGCYRRTWAKTRQPTPGVRLGFISASSALAVGRRRHL